MGNFNRGDRFSGANRNSDFNRGGRSDRPSMHRAVCADCGKDCEVPFKPTGDKPVYCSNCFSNKDTSSGRSERKFTVRESFGDKKMFKAVCSKCHKDCEVPFRPTTDKPIFCSECFGRGEGRENENKKVSLDQYKKEFEALNNKLDNILSILASKTPVKEKIEKVVKEEVKEEVKEVELVKEVKKVAPKKISKSKVAIKKAAPKKTVKKKTVKKKITKKK